ncbi:terpene synthase family protein [Streptomyces sp. NPDC050504]|uniref:terpene synthase family protein n=1 Tax=Streptomyces sp. NPDC050504 TaxID=3365618 RepID=UPI00378F9455
MDTSAWAKEALPRASRWLQLPCRRHRHASLLEHQARRWAAESGLATGAAGSRLRAHGLERLAATAMSEERDDQVLLYAHWLVWVFCLDDHVETRTGPQEIDALFRALTARTGGNPPGDRGGRPPCAVEAALGDLWERTCPRTSHHWRARFRRHLREQHAGCLREHRMRRAGAVPTPEEYPLLRRRSSGLWLYDLPEAVLDIELPPAFAATALWRELVRHISDAANWCNDVLSHPKETADELTVNYLLVARHHLGLAPGAALHWVTRRIVDRLDRAAALGTRVPDTAQRLGLSPHAVRGVSRVACAVLNFPSAYLSWALESGRYTDRTSPTAPLSPTATGVSPRAPTAYAGARTLHRAPADPPAPRPALGPYV